MLCVALPATPKQELALFVTTRTSAILVTQDSALALEVLPTPPKIRVETRPRLVKTVTSISKLWDIFWCSKVPRKGLV